MLQLTENIRKENLLSKPNLKLNIYGSIWPGWDFLLWMSLFFIGYMVFHTFSRWSNWNETLHVMRSSSSYNIKVKKSVKKWSQNTWRPILIDFPPKQFQLCPMIKQSLGARGIFAYHSKAIIKSFTCIIMVQTKTYVQEDKSKLLDNCFFFGKDKFNKKSSALRPLFARGGKLQTKYDFAKHSSN